MFIQGVLNSYDTAKKIIGTRKFHLGNPSNMNDGLEFSSTSMDCSKVYFSSFSIERSENIGMWSMYGQPWEKGIKISIPKKAFMSWTEQMSEIFEVNTISSENDFNKPIDSRYFKPSIARVAYVELDKDGNVNQIRCGDNAKNNKIKSVNSKILSGYIKDDAWSYEKEIRLRVDLQDKTNAKRIAVNIPDNIMKSIIITTGPRFDKQIIDNDFLGIAKVNRSIFTGKLTYVYCDECRSRVV